MNEQETPWRWSPPDPACPRLEDEAIRLRRIGAEWIGVTLGEDHQLVPEQSTSALVCHHPSAKYFTL